MVVVTVWLSTVAEAVMSVPPVLPAAYVEVFCPLVSVVPVGLTAPREPLPKVTGVPSGTEKPPTLSELWVRSAVSVVFPLMRIVDGEALRRSCSHGLKVRDDAPVVTIPAQPELFGPALQPHQSLMRVLLTEFENTPDPPRVAVLPVMRELARVNDVSGLTLLGEIMIAPPSFDAEFPVKVDPLMLVKP